MRRLIIIFSIVLVALIATPFIIRSIKTARIKAEYKEVLATAKKKGLPTTWAEFENQGNHCLPKDNADVFYLELEEYKRTMRPDDRDLDSNLLFAPSSFQLLDTKRFLESNRDALQLIEKATSRPHCQVLADWSQGYALVTEEWALIKDASLLLEIRACYRAQSGDVAGALRDFDRLMVMARHCDEDLGSTGHYRALSIRIRTLKNVASLVVRGNPKPTFRAFLIKLVDQFPDFDPQKVFRMELVSMLDLIDKCNTPEGRKKLGIPESELKGLIGKLLKVAQSEDQARLRIAKGMLAYWEALSLPVDQMDEQCNKAQNEYLEGLVSFPYAANIYSMISSSPSPSSSMRLTIAYKQILKALIQTTATPSLPKMYKTDYLTDPWLHVPLKYLNDGKHLLISAGEPGSKENGAELNIPLR
jgi:hypothetical protein